MPSDDPGVRTPTDDLAARRTAAARTAGTARMANADPAELLATRRAAASAVNSPAALARRIVKAWPSLDRTERAEIRAILEPLSPRGKKV